MLLYLQKMPPEYFMFTEKTLRQMWEGMEKWLAEVRKALNSSSAKKFSTVSDLDVKPLYTPEDIKDLDFADIGYPGFYPFTRGVQATGYRGRPWTIRLFSGFGTASDTNQRWHQLLKEG
ncbi:MAG: methylmalonyl-CoA mutase family protein, partial [Dehalococcoidales bacterium]|nr:methylmalonyl-CoA mutase family protein [Dehalococcoidales bacterium]